MLSQLLLGLCIGFPAVAQTDLDKRITFKHPVASVRAVVEALGQAAGVRLSAAPALKHEIVYVNVKEVKLVDLMNRISDLVASAWTEESGGYVLSRSSSKLKQEEDEQYQVRLNRFTKALEKFSKQLVGPITEKSALATIRELREVQKDLSNSTGSFNPARYKKYEQLQRSSPGRRALVRMILALGPQQLAAVKPDERVVFSTNPTRMQRPISGPALQAITDLNAEQAAWAAAHAKLPDPEQMAMPEIASGEENALEAEAFIQQEDYISVHDPMGPKKAFKNPPAKAFLIINPSDLAMGGGTLVVSLHVCDANGKLLLSAREMIGAMFDEEDAQAFEDILKPVPNEKEIEFTGVITELQKSWSTNARGPNLDPVSLSKESLEILTHPEKHEPLDLSCTSPMEAVAQAKKANIVAVLPDFLFLVPVTPMEAGTPKLTPSVYLRFLDMAMFSKLEEKDGWIMVRPSDPIQARRVRADRDALGKYLRRLQKEGRLTLDNVAEYAQSSEDQAYGLSQILGNLVIGSGISLLIEGRKGEFNYLKLYGSLTPSQRQTLMGGGSLRIGQLSPFQQSLVARIVYGPGEAWGMDRRLELLPAEPNSATDDETDLDHEVWSEFSMNLEPTQALPSGLPSEGTLTLKSVVSDVIFTSSEDQRYANFAQEIDGLAFTLYAKDHLDKFPWAADQGRFKDFQAGRQTKMTLTFRFFDRIGAVGTLTDQYKLGKPGPLTDLPPDIQKRLQDAIKQHADAYRDMPPPTDDPPPPR